MINLYSGCLFLLESQEHRKGKREGGKEIEGEQASFSLLVHSPAVTGTGQSQNQKSESPIWRDIELLELCISRKLESGPETGIKSKHSERESVFIARVKCPLFYSCFEETMRPQI